MTKEATEMELLIKEFFSSDNLSLLAKFQSEEQAKQRARERKNQIREKYEFYKHRLNNGEILKKESYDEWLFVKFMMEDYDE